MKISELLQELDRVQRQHGDIEVQIQDSPRPGEMITDYEVFFIVPEEYEDGGICNLRWWPY